MAAPVEREPSPAPRAPSARISGELGLLFGAKDVWAKVEAEPMDGWIPVVKKRGTAQQHPAAHAVTGTLRPKSDDSQCKSAKKSKSGKSAKCLMM